MYRQDGTAFGLADWADNKAFYYTVQSCWIPFTEYPRIGDVAGSGSHVGIVTEPRETTSAMADRVEKSEWGFRKGQRTVFWRHMC